MLREGKREQSQRLGKRGWVTALNKNKSRRSQGQVGRERGTQSHKLRQQGQVGVRNEKGTSSQSSEAVRQAGQHAAPRGHTDQQGRGRSRRCGKVMGDQGAGK